MLSWVCKSAHYLQTQHRDRHCTVFYLVRTGLCCFTPLCAEAGEHCTSVQCLKSPCRIPSCMLRYSRIHGCKSRAMMDLPGEQSAVPSVAATQHNERENSTTATKAQLKPSLEPIKSHINKTDKDRILVSCSYFNLQLTSSIVKLHFNHLC